MKTSWIKQQAEIETIAEGGKILRDILHKAGGLARPGVSTWELNQFAEKEIANAGGRPSFKDYGPKKNPFPAGLCTSINDVVVHGIPSNDEILKIGDIVGLDIGMEYKGLYTDTAITVAVGRISANAQKLLDITKKCLDLSLKEIKPGVRIGVISSAVQKTAEEAGFSVVRDLVGHGVGYSVHEDPAVPCYGKPSDGPVLQEGMVLAVEPMVCAGDWHLIFDNDGWTVRTKDGSLSAHFEHTVAVTKNGARILT
jgi:methionyl aminopeptidase